MRRLWTLAALALSLTAAGCGKQDDSKDSMRGMDGTTPMKDSQPMAGMQGMPGMSEMERMGHGPATPGGTDTAGVPVDRPAAERLGITFARAATRPIAAGTRVVGTLTYAEPRREYVNARVMGWVEKLYADYEGKPVRKGDALLALYAPELVSAQEEYLSAKQLGDSTLVAAARRRLTLWDIPEDQIELLDRTGKAQRTLLLRAPMSGEIAEKKVVEGQAVQAGDNLFLIADRGVLWVDLAVFETDARMLHVGVPVELTVDALAGRTYQGRVTFIHPSLDTTTRTLTARVEVRNRDGRLRPGMYVTARLTPASTQQLTVPLTAVLPTGTRQLVFVNRGDGQFVPRDVKTGTRSDSLVEIVSGLKPGDEIVASATYLLDSESNLAAAMQGLMLQMGMGLNMGGMQTPGGGEMKGMDMKGMPGMKDTTPQGGKPR
ncbi:MAG TPA: efflux RND transporter periplasmic adaptor subunit, partial [Gemmatimonadales bacterium]|nr:efflux RND transporter periplasmic adaptor subunit [Gemmatimonadales bacterium]